MSTIASRLRQVGRRERLPRRPTLAAGRRMLPHSLAATSMTVGSLPGGLSQREAGRAPGAPGARLSPVPLVARIDRHKYAPLALALTAAFFAVPEHDGGQMTRHVADIGGYVAIAGLALGLPALIYAMVTDSTVERIWEKVAHEEDFAEVDVCEGSAIIPPTS